MSHFGRPAQGGAYAQPVTDAPGRWLTAALGPVAGYNLLVLLTFPFAAGVAYLLARHLAIAPPFAHVAALAFAFAPFHLAQAAYHVHIAQTQWIALYLLALWRGLDRATAGRLMALAAAVGGVTLSNLYGGLIAAAITPVAVLGYAAATSPSAPGGGRRALIVSATLLAIAGGGLAVARVTGHPALVNPAAYGYPPADLARYSAAWWSYLVPPLAHPVLGSTAADIFAAAGIREGRLEQQVTLGWGFLALAAAAMGAWFRRSEPAGPLTFVPVLIVVAVAAFICSLQAEWTLFGWHLRGPSALIHQALPMFRSYARFGVVVQLMTVLLAAIGAQWLWSSRRRALRVGAVALLALGAAEYTVSPLALSRDVLPTRAHRWMVQQPGATRALDCAPLTVESGSVEWLTAQRISMRSGTFDECAAPDVAGRLAAAGYTHLIVRQGTADARWIRTSGTPAGMTRVAKFRDAEVFAVAATAAPVYTARMTGFYPREYEGRRTWRWMGQAGRWEVINSSGQAAVATLDVELAAFGQPRRLRVRLDGDEVQTLQVAEAVAAIQVHSLILTPGRHTVDFEALEPAATPSRGDRRALSVSFGAWRWRVNSRP